MALTSDAALTESVDPPEVVVSFAPDQLVIPPVSPSKGEDVEPERTSVPLSDAEGNSVVHVTKESVPVAGEKIPLVEKVVETTEGEAVPVSSTSLAASAFHESLFVSGFGNFAVPCPSVATSSVVVTAEPSGKSEYPSSAGVSGKIFILC